MSLSQFIFDVCGCPANPHENDTRPARGDQGGLNALLHKVNAIMTSYESGD